MIANLLGAIAILFCLVVVYGMTFKEIDEQHGELLIALFFIAAVLGFK